ncbi:hypothetical protein QAD02_023490 [Eretmocerus hayati]|uniref:Uncharacterized protein n=1 Tax=Eretmocerus hayati TaxID=131215 RepID=A0ACC2PVZ6_9HYME|nr:hypothetical protein QAD02_023490 [Eretmocerus hayati]
MLARRDVIQSFLKHGADPNSTSPRRGEDILCLAIKSKLSSSQKKMDKIYIDILKLLIDHGARLFPTVDDTKSKNPVKIVLQYGNVLAFQLFLKYGLTLDRCKDWFPLHCAAKNNDSKVLEFLLIQKRFDIDQIDSDGYTPLHAAVEFNKIECVKILLAYKAEVNCINDVIYVSPLGIALELQDIDCMRLLISYGADVNLFRDDARIPLVVAVCNDFQECAELLLANNAKLLVFDELHSMNIYEIALATDNPKMLEILDAYKFLLASQEVNNEPSDPHLIDAALVGQDEELNSIRHMTEIALMQTSIIYGTTTFYEILTNKKICASYVENESVIRALESETLKDKFPIYSQSLINRFAEAKNHADLLKRATDKLSKILGFDAHLYYLVARRILAHFDEKDLHGLTLI